jgi:hypothetical protein
MLQGFQAAEFEEPDWNGRPALSSYTRLSSNREPHVAGTIMNSAKLISSLLVLRAIVNLEARPARYGCLRHQIEGRGPLSDAISSQQTSLLGCFWIECNPLYCIAPKCRRIANLVTLGYGGLRHGRFSAPDRLDLHLCPRT